MRDQASRNYASEMERDGACRVIAGTLRSMSASGADVRDASANIHRGEDLMKWPGKRIGINS